MNPSLTYPLDVVGEKGASSWLTALPIQEHGFALHKGALRDAICLRYVWTPPRLPTHCVCVSAVSIEHTLNCKCGGFPSLEHNEVRDITADLLTETCPNVLNPHSNHCRVNHCHIVLQLPMIMFVLILLSPVLVLSPKDICGRSCLQSLLLHLC